MPPKESPQSSAANTADEIIPLLLAAHKLKPNFKEMSALDNKKRSESSFEHKFRKWRAKAREILLARDGTTGEATMKPNAEDKKKKRSKDTASDEDGDGPAPRKRAKAAKNKGAEDEVAVKEEAVEGEAAEGGAVEEHPVNAEE